jgi:hypothetical protein
MARVLHGSRGSGSLFGRKKGDINGWEITRKIEFVEGEENAD